ncbi:MAG: glycosyltransferase family 39 protein [Oligoflexales bacterium]|nr:glycosyltransferase family 39 protein [Oligoflexales bacterium]
MDHKIDTKFHEGINTVKFPGRLLLGFALFYGLAANFFPIVQDEAYYYNWGKHLALGYFDHPPAVAWVSWFSQLFGPHFLHGRFATILMGVISLGFMFRLYRLCSFPKKEQFYTACILGAGNAGALVCGFLTTPDAIIMFAWTLALHEAAVAMLGAPKRWLSAGAAVGLGLLGKYTMLLIGPVFLSSLVFAGKRQLGTRWPYLGGLIALLVFSPNLLWNHQNDWLTWRFQLKHGLAQQRAQLVAGQLPSAQKATEGSPEMELASLFASVQSEDKDSKPADEQKKLGPFDKLLAKVKLLSKGDSVFKRFSEFISGQLVFWGALLFVFIGSALLRLRVRTRNLSDSIPRPLKGLLISACLWPLGVFGLFSLNGKVEANWAAMYLIGTAPLIAHYLRPNLRLCVAAACGNLLLIGGVITYSNKPFVKVNPGFDRLLMETHGFRALSYLPELQSGKPLYADKFQLVSMLRYHNQGLQVGQWPGITRASEYVHNETLWNPFGLEELKHKDSFYLLTSDKIPPVLPGFEAFGIKQIQDCREGYLHVRSSQLEPTERACEALRHWYLLEYQKAE